MIRLLVLAKNTRLELRRLLHPMAIIPVRINGKTFPRTSSITSWHFSCLYPAFH
jgi:Trk-type K+ transport system membrane component